LRYLARLGVLGGLLLSPLQSVTPHKPTIVNLKVLHDGRKCPTPGLIKVSFDGRSIQLPVRKGKFEVPPELVAAKSITLEIDTEESHLRLTHVSGKDFAQEDWTIVLAERVYDDDYMWAVPKGTKVRSTCMLVFESVHTDPGRVLFEQHCRTKKKRLIR
jgi:hypothetical protein